MHAGPLSASRVEMGNCSISGADRHGPVSFAVDAGYFHGPLVRFLAAAAQREIRVDGTLRLQLLSPIILPANFLGAVTLRRIATLP